MRIRFARWEFGNGLPRIVLHRSPRIAVARHPARTPPRTRIEETVLDFTDAAKNFDVAFSWLSATCGRRLSTAEQIRQAADSRARLRWRTDVLQALTHISAGVLSNLERQFVRNVERPAPAALPSPSGPNATRHQVCLFGQPVRSVRACRRTGRPRFAPSRDQMAGHPPGQLHGKRRNNHLALQLGRRDEETVPGGRRNCLGAAAAWLDGHAW